MDLLDDSATFEPSELDALGSPFRSVPAPVRHPCDSPVAQQQSIDAPDTPFTAAFKSLSTTSAAQTPPEAPAVEAQEGVLVDLCAPTPRPPPTRPPFLAQQSRPAQPVYAPPRNPSPLKQAFVADDSAEECDNSDEMAFARDSPGLQTARKVGGCEGQEEEQGTPVKPRVGRWSVMLDKSAPRDSSVSPVKEETDPDASSVITLGSDDLSLLLDESPSFLLNTSHDAETTLSTISRSSNLSGINEEDEGNESLGDLLNGLSDSCIGAGGVSLLPSSLTSSTRHALHKSQPASDLASSTATLRPASPPAAERDLLACSTASYRDYRDSPARPRIVSIAAERAAEAATPRKGGRLSEVSEGESRRSSGGSSSGDVGEMLDRWQGEGVSMTDLYSQQPPSPLMGDEGAAVATATFEMGLVSPIQPDKVAAAHAPSSPSPAVVTEPIAPSRPQQMVTDDLIALSTSPPILSSSLPLPPVESTSAQPTAPTIARSASGLERLHKKMEELRARSINSTSVLEPSIAATPVRARLSLAADSTPLTSSSILSRGSTSTVRRPAFTGHGRSKSIPILEDEEALVVSSAPAALTSSTSSLSSSTSSSHSSLLIDFMDAAATPAAKMVRSGAMATPLAFATPSRPLATRPSTAEIPLSSATATVRKPRTSLLPAPSAFRSPTKPSASENVAPLQVPGSVPRKEATRERLDRLKEERRLREAEGTGVVRRSPEKARSAVVAGGLRKPAVATSSRLPPSSSATGAGVAAPRTRLPLGARVAPSTTSTRPSLADVTLAAKKPAVSSRYAFTPSVPRPTAAASARGSSTLGAGVGGKTAAGAGMALKRPSSIAGGVAGAATGGSRIGKPTGLGAPSRIAGLSARPNGAK